MSVVAVIPAAGSGLRLGGGVPKAFRLLDGVSLLARSAAMLAPHVDRLVVAVPAGFAEQAMAMLVASGVPVTVVAGGAERQDSVAACLRELGDPGDGDDVVLVHDAARPLMPGAVVAAVVAAVRAGAPAAIPVLPVADTLKTVLGGVVGATVDRSTLAAVQTPQGFRRDVLVAAHAAAGASPATDDAALVEALGITVTTVPGDPSGFKITTAWDVRVAEALLGGNR